MLLQKRKIILGYINRQTKKYDSTLQVIEEAIHWKMSQTVPEYRLDKNIDFAFKLLEGDSVELQKGPLNCRSNLTIDLGTAPFYFLSLQGIGSWDQWYILLTLRHYWHYHNTQLNIYLTLFTHKLILKKWKTQDDWFPNLAIYGIVFVI